MGHHSAYDKKATILMCGQRDCLAMADSKDMDLTMIRCEKTSKCSVDVDATCGR